MRSSFTKSAVYSVERKENETVQALPEKRPAQKRPARRQRGMALASVMLILMGLLALMLIGTLSGNGVMSNSNNALRMSGTRLQSIAAYNMAESGVEYTLQWLNQQSQPPNLSAAYAPPLWGAVAQGNPARSVVVPDATQPGNSFSVVIYPDAANGSASQKRYLVESVGTSSGFSQTVQAYIEVTSLSKYLVLVDKWAPANNYWVSGYNQFDGPVHDNCSDGHQENIYWKSNAPTPMWSYAGQDAYSVSSPGINWYKDSWYAAGAPQTESEWTKVLAGGQNTVQTNATSVNFPPSSNEQQYVALGQAYPGPGTPPPRGLPTTTGVTVTPGGGVYIHSDVQQMTLGVDGAGNQTITVNQTDSSSNPYTTTVTLNPKNNQTQVHVAYIDNKGKSKHTDTNYTGTTNGVVYCDGNIGNQGDGTGNPTSGPARTGGLSGVVADSTYDASGNLTHRSALTIVTDHSKNCNIDGSITYKTARQKDAQGNYVSEKTDPNFVKYAGALGIVSNNVLITTKDSSGAALNNLEVDATVLASGLYDV
ncbi:MAG: pilus assembly PilX N-terminal domain-containing protein, partial [Armatimonadota bacterium]|nr:pilus assembly PilX N-terminal domain-containing protein [Armatimonadota bacterium]